MGTLIPNLMKMVTVSETSNKPLPRGRLSDFEEGSGLHLIVIGS